MTSSDKQISTNQKPFCLHKSRRSHPSSSFFTMAVKLPLTVDIQEKGVELLQLGYDRRIFLTCDVWENLVACGRQVDEALKTKQEAQWKIDETLRDIRIHIKSFNDKLYLHIRCWWNDHPTKLGVSLLQDDWNHLKTYMTPNKEMSLGLTVMKKLLEKRFKDAKFAACDGCMNDWPSQRDHVHLMAPETTSKIAMDNVSVHPHDFIQALAKEACKIKFILESPHQTFKRISLFHLKEMKQDIAKNEEDGTMMICE